MLFAPSIKTNIDFQDIRWICKRFSMPIPSMGTARGVCGILLNCVFPTMPVPAPIAPIT